MNPGAILTLLSSLAEQCADLEQSLTQAYRDYQKEKAALLDEANGLRLENADLQAQIAELEKAEDPAVPEADLEFHGGDPVHRVALQGRAVDGWDYGIDRAPDPGHGTCDARHCSKHDAREGE